MPSVSTSKDAKTLTKIPVLPISYADAQPLLAALKGAVAPEAWRGALPHHLSHRTGAGESSPARCSPTGTSSRSTTSSQAFPARPIPDEWIVRGNHHDAWVNGAEDPVSGTVALMEEARGARRHCSSRAGSPSAPSSTASGTAKSRGCSARPSGPKLTPTNCAGTPWPTSTATATAAASSAWADRTRSKNSSTAWRATSKILKQKITVWKRDQLQSIADAKTAEERKDVRDRADLRIGALGSGSDYTVFLDHLGIASLNLGFGGEDGGGIYHSIYDDFYWYTHFSDTDFAYGRALAQTAGTAVIRLADADLLPYDFTGLADTIHRYLDEIQKLLQTKQDDVVERNKEIQEGVFTATADPKKTSVPPPTEEVPPHLNFAPLQNASESLTHSAERYQKALEKIAINGQIWASAAQLQALNEKLMQSERKLVSPEGLPGRPWFQHLIYAPGAYTGYGVKTIPGVREAIEQKQWKEADQQIIRVANALQAEAALIDSATQELERAQ